MKVVLLQDVKKLGKKGDIVSVKDGYAANFLIPKKLAVPATDGIVKSITLQKQQAQAKKEKERKKLLKLKEKLENTKIFITKKAAGEKLFGSVSAAEIVEKLRKNYNLQISKKNILITQPIKTIGNHAVKVKIGEVEFNIVVVVQKEN